VKRNDNIQGFEPAIRKNFTDKSVEYNKNQKFCNFELIHETSTNSRKMKFKQTAFIYTLRQKTYFFLIEFGLCQGTLSCTWK